MVPLPCCVCPLPQLVLGHMVRKAGLEVVEAANGAEALEKICTNPPGRFDCILMVRKHTAHACT